MLLSCLPVSPHPLGSHVVPPNDERSLLCVCAWHRKRANSLQVARIVFEAPRSAPVPMDQIALVHDILGPELMTNCALLKASIGCIQQRDRFLTTCTSTGLQSVVKTHNPSRALDPAILCGTRSLHEILDYVFLLLLLTEVACIAVSYQARWLWEHCE
jgi:hypothetical protein